MRCAAVRIGWPRLSRQETAVSARAAEEGELCTSCGNIFSYCCNLKTHMYSYHLLVNSHLKNVLEVTRLSRQETAISERAGGG